MSIRTDLAIENEKNLIESRKIGEVNLSFLQNSIGKYYTLEFQSIEKVTDTHTIKKEIFNALVNLLPEKKEKILVVGLGNYEITSDSIGPRVAEKILATRHIVGEFAESIGLKGLKSVSVMAPNVLGKTGIEVCELVKGAVNTVKPDAVIAVDALCSKSVSRLFSCIQLCNCGIAPGSGVKNSRKELSKKTLGVPVVAIGVPTVVDALTIAFELTGKEAEQHTDMIVTPKDADLLCKRISDCLSEALNVFLQPDIDEEVILSLV